MTTNSPNPVDGDVQALIDWLKPQIAELENICDELPFGLDEDDAMQLKVMRFALDRLNATAQPVSDEWVKCSEQLPAAGETVLVYMKEPIHSVTDYAIATYDKYGFSRSRVTHWMPLPAAPGGQDD